LRLGGKPGINLKLLAVAVYLCRKKTDNVIKSLVCERLKYIWATMEIESGYSVVNLLKPLAWRFHKLMDTDRNMLNRLAWFMKYPGYAISALLDTCNPTQNWVTTKRKSL